MGIEAGGSTLTVSVVIPAFNEERGVGGVVRAARAVPEVDEVLVVDDGSSDRTAAAAKRAGARVVRLAENRGKGHAMAVGRAESAGDVLVFLDADLAGLSPRQVRRIIAPFADGHDFVKTRFARRAGRVTALTAKPLLGWFFPEIEERFEQPLSGQIGVKRELMDELELEPDMGVDVGLLIDVVVSGARTTEVDFGWLTHEEKRLSDLDEMARAVTRVILERANRYGRVDEVLQSLDAETW